MCNPHVLIHTHTPSCKWMEVTFPVSTWSIQYNTRILEDGPARCFLVFARYPPGHVCILYSVSNRDSITTRVRLKFAGTGAGSDTMSAASPSCRARVDRQLTSQRMEVKAQKKQDNSARNADLSCCKLNSTKELLKLPKSGASAIRDNLFERELVQL